MALLLAGPTAAEVEVRNLYGRTARDLALYITGCGIVVADVRYVGTNTSAGTFVSSDPSVIGFSEGMVMSSGTVSNIPGPNDSSSATGNNNLAGDSQLDALSGKTTHDATFIEFDFVPDPGTTSVNFDYVFASEEYNEYANSAFNDVFAFLLNGQNVALLPGTTTPVAINEVNGGNPYGSGAVNGQYYICNAQECCSPMTASCSATRFAELEMDGLTVVFTVTATVNPGIVNRMKFAIADASDSVLDSVVFIRAGSFGAKCGAGSSSASVPLTAAGMIPEEVHGYPNPYRPGSGGEFDGGGVILRSVPPGGVVDIYTVTGKRVASTRDEDFDGTALWNARNSEGREVESGIYILVARRAGHVVSRGKLVVVR